MTMHFRGGAMDGEVHEDLGGSEDFWADWNDQQGAYLVSDDDGNQQGVLLSQRFNLVPEEPLKAPKKLWQIPVAWGGLLASLAIILNVYAGFVTNPVSRASIEGIAFSILGIAFTITVLAYMFKDR